MKLKRLPQNSREKDSRKPGPERASLSLLFNRKQHWLLLVFISHRQALAQVTQVTETLRAQMVSIANVVSVRWEEGNIRLWYRPLSRFRVLEPALRSGDSLRCPPWACSRGCTGCARLLWPSNKLVQYLPAPSRYGRRRRRLH